MSANQEAAPYYNAGGAAHVTVVQPQPPPSPYQQPAPRFPRNTLGTKGICTGIGFALVVVGIVNLLGLYMWPGKYDCRMTIKLKQSFIDTLIDETNKVLESVYSSGSRSSSEPITLTPAQEAKIECNNLHNVYYTGNVLFMFSSILAGLCMAIAAFEQSKLAAVGSAIFLIGAMMFIVMQMISVYEYSITRYWRPALSVDAQKTLTVLLGLVFLGIYGACIGFATCLTQEIRSAYPNYMAAGVYPPPPASVQVLQQASPSNYQPQQQAPYYAQPQQPYGAQVVPAQVSPPVQ